MPSARDKRAAARARLEQRMAEKAAAAKKRRTTQVTIASVLAAVLVIGLGTWLVIGLGGDEGEATAAGNCTYPVVPNMGMGTNIAATGTPPSDQPDEGTRDFTMQTNHGDIVFQLDLTNAPCTSGSFAFLSQQNYFTGSKCHRLTTEGLYVLQCGDPSGTGSGGPSYSVPDENLPPAGTDPNYPAGTVAMAEAQGSDPGSQFFIVYEDTTLPPNYTRVGFVTSGLDVVRDIADKGAVDKEGKETTDGAPKDPVTIKGTSVGGPNPVGIPVNPWSQPAGGDSGSPSAS